MSKKGPITVNEAYINREMGLHEVRTLLLTTIENLKSSNALEAVAGKQLKDFWQKDFPPAPFEELFTLKQIAEIDIDTFFKKRSVLPSKILGIIAAVEKAITSGNTIKPKKTLRKEPAAKPAESESTAVNKKLRSYEIQYNMLISKCEMMVETLKLAGDEAGFEKKNAKALKAIADDIKKIDKILTSNHNKLSDLI